MVHEDRNLHVVRPCRPRWAWRGRWSGVGVAEVPRGDGAGNFGVASGATVSARDGVDAARAVLPHPESSKAVISQ